MRELPSELQKIAIEELNENVARIPEDLKHIKDWLAKQPHIKARTDDQLLLTFLRGCKYSLEKTKEKLDFYYTARSLCPEFYTNRDPFLPEIQEILKLGSFLPLPKVLPNSQRVVLLVHKNVDPSKIKLVDIFKTNLMIMEILLNEDDHGIIAGAVSIQDMKYASLQYFAQSPIHVIKKFMTTAQKGYPSRPKNLYFLNIPTYFDAMLSVFKQFLTEKNRSRIKIFTENENDKFFEEFPKSMLPKEYGGDAGTLEELTAYWKQKVESYRDWFIEDDKYGTDEKKRPGKPKSSDEIFGVEGSFRKLDID